MLYIIKYNILSYLILLLGGGAISKIYGPSSVADYNLYLTTLLSVSTFLTLRLENVIIMSKKDSDSINIFSYLFIITFILFFILLFILFYLKKNLYIYGLVAGFICSWINIKTSILVRYKQYIYISKSLLFSSLICIILQFLTYKYMGKSTINLIYSNILSKLVCLIYLFIISKNYYLINLNFKNFIHLVWKNKNILKHTLASDMFNIFLNNILLFILIYFFNKNDIGVYIISYKILLLPIFFISTTFSKIFFYKISKLVNNNNNNIHHVILKAVLSCFIILFVYFLIIYYSIDYIILHLLDFNWIGIKYMIRSLFFLFLTKGSTILIQQVVIIFKKNYYAIYFNIYIVICLIYILFNAKNNDIYHIIYMYSIFVSIGHISQLIFIIKYLKKMN